MIISNAQLRYTIFFVPILLYHLIPLMTKKQFKIQLIISIMISLIIIFPYITQIKYSTNGEEITTLLQKMFLTVESQPATPSASSKVTITTGKLTPSPE